MRPPSKSLEFGLCGGVEHPQPDILTFNLRSNRKQFPSFLHNQVKRVGLVDLNLFDVELVANFQNDEVFQVFHFQCLLLFDLLLLGFQLFSDISGQLDLEFVKWKRSVV